MTGENFGLKNFYNVQFFFFDKQTKNKQTTDWDKTSQGLARSKLT